MSKLVTYSAETGVTLTVHEDYSAIIKELSKVGVMFAGWDAKQPLDEHSSDDEVIEAYHQDIDLLMQRHGFESVDVINLTADHPEKESLRNKFAAEHSHSDDEVRFFVEGAGLFYLHIENKVYGVLCEKGDLISVPAKVRHWFDMGGAPNFKCIRLFTNQEGWLANYSGSDVANRFPSFEQFIRQAAA